MLINEHCDCGCDWLGLVLGGLGFGWVGDKTPMFAVVSDPEITRVSLNAIFHPHPSHAANACNAITPSCCVRSGKCGNWY